MQRTPWLPILAALLLALPGLRTANAMSTPPKEQLTYHTGARFGRVLFIRNEAAQPTAFDAFWHAPLLPSPSGPILNTPDLAQPDWSGAVAAARDFLRRYAGDFLGVAVAWRSANNLGANDQRRSTETPLRASVATVELSAPTPASNPAAWIEQRRKQIEQERRLGRNEWRTPIKFFGKVLDEHTNPVVNARVHFVWTDLSDKGSSEKDTLSDAEGLFSLSGATGKSLIVQVSKEGYYAYQEFGAGFNYAGENQTFTPDAANPAVFRLKKKGVAEPLVVSKHNFQISISGKPLEIDLRTGTAVLPGQGDVVLEFVRQTPPPGGRLYDWSFKCTVPNGGLVLSTDEFSFIAPDRGYESSDLMVMKAASKDTWQSDMKRGYFIKLPDGKFARVVLDLMSHNGSLQIQVFVNPSGSRNLEFDPAVK